MLPTVEEIEKHIIELQIHHAAKRLLTVILPEGERTRVAAHLENLKRELEEKTHE